MYRYLHFHTYIYIYIHSKYSFNVPILSSLEVDPLSLLGDAVVIFQADLHTVHLGEFFFFLKVGNQTGTPLFFLLAHQKKNLVQTLVFSTKEENIQLKSFFFWKQTPFFCWKKWVSYHPEGGRNVSIFHGWMPWFLRGNDFFFQKVDNGSKGNLCKKYCVFLLMKLSSCFFC